MSGLITPELLNSTRDIFNEAVRDLIVDLIRVQPTHGHRTWYQIIKLARIGCDMDRAKHGRHGPEAGPDQSWESLPRRFLTQVTSPDEAEHDKQIALAKQLLTERLS
jgi:hypothetical protein